MHPSLVNPWSPTKKLKKKNFKKLKKYKQMQIDLQERRSRRDMSPQGRKRVAGMVARDYRTVSGIGQSYHNQV